MYPASLPSPAPAATRRAAPSSDSAAGDPSHGSAPHRSSPPERPGSSPRASPATARRPNAQAPKAARIRQHPGQRGKGRRPDRTAPSPPASRARPATDPRSRGAEVAIVIGQDRKVTLGRRPLREGAVKARRSPGRPMQHQGRPWGPFRPEDPPAQAARRRCGCPALHRYAHPTALCIVASSIAASARIRPIGLVA